MPSTTSGIGSLPGIASLTQGLAQARGDTQPPGLSSTSRVTPWTMNMVASVTTIGCSPRNAMKKPLKAPVAMPMPMPISVHSNAALTAVRHVGGEHDVDERDDRAGRQVETADQNDERLACRGYRQRGAAERQEAELEIAHAAAAHQIVDGQQSDEHGERDDEPLITRPGEPEAAADEWWRALAMSVMPPRPALPPRQGRP